MEEKLKDVYENIKDRLSNPLIFSFISSWLICNWRIPVALIWYDKSQFSGCGCNTIFDYIELTYAKYGNTWLPVLIAFGYTLLIPFIKNSIRIVSAQAQKWGEEKEIKILDGGKIGIDKYLVLREDYLSKIHKLEEIINSENKYIDDLNILKTDLEIQKDKVNKINDKSVLNGKWIRSKEYIVANNLAFGENLNFEVLRISNGKCFLNNENVARLFITEFFNNVDIKKIMFQMKYEVTMNISGDENFKVFNFILNYDETFTLMKGNMNERNIELTKEIV